MQLNKQRLRLKFNWLRLLLYMAIGSLIFYFNSQLEFNYIAKGYLVLLESQLCILAIYFMTNKLNNKPQKKW